jgi:hypothetical protein
MERAVTNSKEATHITKVDAFDYRDGLLIALLARRRTLAALRIGKHLVKSGALWSLDIPAKEQATARI